MNVNEETYWIDPHQIRFSRDAGGQLFASWNGDVGPVTVRRLFPLTRSDSVVAVAGSNGCEWGVLRSTTGMDSSSKAVLTMELKISPYLPHIERISMIRRRFNQFIWEVDTDYGKLSFVTGPIYEAAVNLQNGDRLITDLENQKYIVPMDSHLDKSSRKTLAKWL